jgi:hypothetical protein
MTTITIPLSDEYMLKLREQAKRLHVAPEELARVSIEELLAQPDDAFERAVELVLTKNKELYRRLA